jgi:UDP-2-acetamido-2,6-beta-L-arabino-hexul-4-ose reductase
MTNERYEIVVFGDKPRVVETVPGWEHDVMNIGDGEMVAVIWANEIFDPTSPDTISSKVEI